ncbi:MAG: asparagine synthase C-terminal domain-containing protein [Chthonomonadaceae bacterium]|nr:asparagine synthase C-terminal domain-containing protein [Chthonomonadaceae bacterium]
MCALPAGFRVASGLCGVYGSRDPAHALRHAGVEPVWHNAEVAFGGAPVWTDTTGHVVVCGDVLLYNVASLQAQLQCSARAHGEILAELVRRYGVAEGARQARGMFAVAIWREPERELVLLRDAVGARTLYHARQGSFCWFADRLSVLRRTPAVSCALSLTALRHYLSCAFVPGEETMWRDAQELAPGTAYVFPGDRRILYWEPVQGEWDPEAPLPFYARCLRPLLEDAVQQCLPASGPVGVYLSGGLDSSLVTALAARYAPGAVHTFAIHFGPEYPNELEFSALVARHCGTEHHVLELRAEVVREHLPETLALLDDPIGDPLTTPNLLLGRAAFQETSVVLNGEGGDPCFGGPKNQPMLLHALYGATQSEEDAYFRSYQKCYDDLPELLTPEVQRALRDAPPQSALLEPFFSNPRMPAYLNRLMHINVRLKGADHILTKVNNLTRACGLVGHSPLFDPRIVEASFAVPPAFKLSGATEKVVLKAAVADLLPQAILARPKSGMLVPVQGWFRRELNSYARALLLDRRARTRPYLNSDTVRQWLEYRGDVWSRYGVKLWLLLTLEVWLRVQEDL